jgi:hypothetical protein
LVTRGSPDNTAENNVLKPMLAGLGIHITSEYAMPLDDNLAQTQVGNVVNQFKAHHVDHVLFLESNGAAFFFIGAADGAKYFPRYSITTDQYPGVVATELPPADLKNSIGIGWAPTVDVDIAHDPGDNPTTAKCVNIVRQSGINFTGRTAGQFVGVYCDGLSLLQSAFSGTGSDITPAGLQAGVERLGSSFSSAVTWATQFGPGRHDGAAAYRILTFDSSCKCYHYTGENIPVVPYTGGQTSTSSTTIGAATSSSG